MKAPISKKLAEDISLPFFAITIVALYDLYTASGKRFEQNIVFLLFFGIPTILLAWFLLVKNTEFKEVKKVRKAERLFQLPFSSFSCLLIFIISSFFIVGGLGGIITDKNISVGLSMLLTGLSVFILTAIAVEHPKIWFSETINIEDEIDRIKNIPRYEDGDFSYFESGFEIQIDKVTKTINWDEISLIQVYKIDLYTYDSIVIEIKSDKTFLAISEETAGYMKFMEIAAEKLEDFKKDWFLIVAFPAFEKNLTTIYQRSESDEEQIRKNIN